MKGQLAAFLDPQGVGAFLDHQAVRGLVDGGGAEVKVQALQQLVPGLAVPGGQGFVTVYTGQTGAFGRTRVLGSRLSARASFSKASWPPMGVRPSWASGRVRSLSRIWPR